MRENTRPPWAVPDNYVSEARPQQAFRELVVNGSVTVQFQRGPHPAFFVAGETPEAVASVRTYFNGDKLLIEREGITAVRRGASISISGSVSGQVSANDILNFNKAADFPTSAKVMVGISLLEAPAVTIKGSGDAVLADLDQPNLDLSISGSGDIRVNGKVATLGARVTGSGDIDAHELLAESATVSVTGSGDIECFVRSSVRARVTGSGDITVLGNPQHRDHSVSGSGKIKFR
ncbi:DUF2807 domain-containing protein (plasmid) [Achromobacter seleniivolatilans]|uniref:DUF2807 domain-containing protein n=1 Tax=Achromobacter seleniivolatilans TaxID=3047478 RepID=A0ABY9MB08_9BURK|nr:DUF2807 domain-containing protein [Achromobacter sp. R39]WMD24055.1 DUF2807 domain-containing protein [Achromobacter sp. R39]